MRQDKSGVFFRRINATKFKTTKISVTLLAPLARETAAGYAVLPGLLSRSCAKYPDFTALKRKLAMLYGASVSGSAVAQGDAHAITLSISALDDRYAISGGNISGECAELLCEMLFNPNLANGFFPYDDVEAEKRQLSELIEAQQNDRVSYAMQRCVEEMCGGEPHGVNPLGTVDTVNALTPQSVTEAWRKLMSTARVEVIATGNMDVGKVERSIREAFGRRGGYAPLPPNIVLSPRKEVNEHTETVSASQSKLVLGYRTSISNQSGDPFAARMMCECLGGAFSSRLFLNVREKLSLCYYCNSVYNRQKGLLFIQSGLERRHVGRAREEITAQIKYIQNGNLTDEEIGNARLSVKDGFLSRNDSIFGLDSWYRSQFLSDEILSPEEAVRRIMSITPEQIAEAARTFTLDTAYLLTGEEQTNENQ